MNKDMFKVDYDVGVRSVRFVLLKWFVPTIVLCTFLFVANHCFSLHKSQYATIDPVNRLRRWLILATLGALVLYTFVSWLSKERFERIILNLMSMTCECRLIIVGGTGLLIILIVLGAMWDTKTVVITAYISVSVIIAPLILLILLICLASKRPREVVKGVILVVSSLLFSVLIVELLFRSLVVQSVLPETEKDFERLLNSNSMHALQIDKSQETFRILGVSDSFGTAGGEHNYHYLLEKLLRQSGYNVEVVNISAVGYHPSDQVVVVRRYGLRFKPDLIIHGFFVGNDFTTATNSFEVEYASIPVPYRKGIAALLPHNFVFFRWVYRYISLILKDIETVNVDGEGGGVTTSIFPERDFLRIEYERMAVCRREAVHKSEWAQVAQILKELMQLAKQSGAQYLLVAHPDQYQVEAKLREKISAVYDIILDDYDFEKPHSYLRDICRSNGMQYLNMLPDFRREGKGGGLYLLRNTHYNNRGNELVAQKIFEYIVRNKLIPAKYLIEDRREPNIAVIR